MVHTNPSPENVLPVQVCKELHRFEKLMEYFRNEDSNIDFMVRTWAWVRCMPCPLRLCAA